MLTETRKLDFLDGCNKMQSLSSTIQLPELIRSFDPKFNQQKDVSQVKSEKRAKMKLRDVRDVLEIARLKVLVSEMKEKAVKLEAQVLAAAEECGRSSTQGNKGVEKAKAAEHASIKNLQSMTINSRELVEKQDAKLDKNIAELHAQIKTLESCVNEMALQLRETPGLQKELASAMEKIRTLQEENEDDAGITKSQLLLLKQQLGELEKIRIATECKELEFRRASQLSSALEAEVEEMRKGNKELLNHKQELSGKLVKASKKAETITAVKKDDVLASQEVSRLRAMRTKLQKKVDSLQMSRFNEVEEVVYLRWVNACLQHDLDTHKASHRDSEDTLGQSKDRAPSTQGNYGALSPHGRDNHRSFALCTNSGHSSTTCSEVCECLASQTDDDKSSLSCESSTMSIPRIAVLNGHVNRSSLSPPGHLNKSQASSPQSNTHNHVNGGHGSPLSISHGNMTNSPESPLSIMHAHVRSHGVAKIKSGTVFEAQQLSQSREAHSPRRCSPGKVVAARVSQKLAENESRLSFNNRSRRSGISIERSVSDSFPLFETPFNHVQSKVAPRKQDPSGFRRFSSDLSSGTDISVSNRSMHAVTSRRHSAPSGAELPKRREHTHLKAHSAESNLDTTDRVVAAFQVLSTSSHKSKYPASEIGHTDSNDDATSKEFQKSQPRANSTRPDFLCDLAEAIQATHYTSIEKVAAFVDWFDRQGDKEKQDFCNFPKCPKNKVAAMRRVVYEYEELLALERDLKSSKDDSKSPTDLALKRMKNLLEKAEKHIEGFKQARELAMVQFTELELPTYWMLDSEMIAKIKQASLKLAQKYINRILNALQNPLTTAKSRDEMLLQSSRFLLQLHNFAGGFDVETASAFKMLRSQAEE